MILEEPDGATPLDPDEADGLRLTHITTRGELNRWEQENIAAGEAWAFGRRHRDILDEGFVRRLHKRMFGEVWRWAGEYRRCLWSRKRDDGSETKADRFVLSSASGYVWR